MTVDDRSGHTRWLRSVHDGEGQKTMTNAITGFIPLYQAYRDTMHGKTNNLTALKYHINAAARLFALSSRLDSRTYTVGGYYPFEVYEPKHRLVLALNFEDKVVQHSLCDNTLYHAVARRLITDNYACQIDKGTHFGLERLKEKLRHYFFSRKARDEEARRARGQPMLPRAAWDYADGWVLKGDVKGFFYHLRHDVCKQIAHEAIDAGIKDSELADCARWLTDLFIDSTDDPGIPIGNQSSQLIALLYLDWLDHWMTDDLGLAYGRYMDDFYVIHENKDYLKELLAKIRVRMAEVGLELNHKTQVLPLKNGIDFLGFHTYLTETGKVVMKIRAKSADNMRRKLRKYRELVDNGDMTLEAVWQSYQSWHSHAEHGNCHHLLRDMDCLFDQLFPSIKENLDAAKTISAAEGRAYQVLPNVRRSHTVDCS